MKVLISTVLLVISITLLTSQAQAQNSSVAIGNATPKTNAVLYLRSPGGNQGLIIPIVGSTGSFGEAGMIVYNSGDQKVYFHNGNDWATLGSGGGSGGNYTLEMTGNNLLLKQGATTVSTVPLAAAAPTAANQFLTWDGSKWVATAFTQDAANVNGSITVNGLKGKPLPTLPSTTQVLVYNGSAWFFQPLTGGTDSQDLSLNSTTNILSLTNDATTVDLTTYKQNLGLTGTGSAATGESFPLTISSGTGVTIREGTNVQIDQAANVLTINSVAGGAGTVTNVSVANANGFNGTVSNATTTPAITLTTPVTGIIKGNGTAISAAVSGTDYLTPNGSAASLTGFPTFNQNTTGTASTITGNIAQSQVTNLTTDLSNKVTGNTAITAGTNTKITYDAKGLVTAGAALTAADLPVMTSTVGGAVPTPPNNTTTFLRGDGTFATPAGGGTVTAVSVATANGFSGSSSGGATPALTIVAGAITPTSVVATGTVAGSNLSGTNTGDNAVNTLYSSLVSNATHTGDATGATALQVRGINGVLLSGLGTGILKNTTGTGVPDIATGADLPVMTATVGGAVPTPPNNTTTFLRGDGTFAAPASSGWVLTGNSTTNPAINYVGTSDSQPLVFRTNATEAMRVLTDGKVGIGTSTTTSRLGVVNATGTAITGTTNSNAVGSFGVEGINSGTGDVAGFFFASNPAGGINSHGVYGQADGAGTGVFGGNGGTTGNAARFQNFNSANANPVVQIFNTGTGPSLTTAGAVGIGIASPTQPLDVLGNVKFSGSLLPNNLAGTAGQILASAGAGLPPIWTNPTGTTLINNTGLHNLYAGVSVSTSGQDNAFYGYEAGKVNTGSQNTFVGANAGSEKTNGGLSTFMGWYAGNRATGGANTFIGAQAGGTVTTGNVNTFIGEKAGLGTTTGSQNVIVGSQAGQANISGTQLVLIGQTANVGDDDLINAVAIGYGAVVNANNTMVFGTSSTTGWGLGTQPVAGRAVVVGTAATNGNGAYLTTGGVWTNASDRNKKENFTELNTSEILEKVKLLSVTRWNYKGDPSTVTHIGPMAQDFYSLFKTGDDDKSISTIDPSGVALLSIQELIKKIEELETQNQKLSAEKGVLEAKVTSIEDQHKSLMEDVQELKRILGAEAKK